MTEPEKKRIKDRLAGIRFTVEENLSLVEAGVAFAHLKGQLDMLDIIEHTLADFIGDEDEHDN